MSCERFLFYSCWLNVDHCGIAGAQAPQFVAYQFRFVLVAEKLLPRVISRPPGGAPVIPARDPRISPGSKRDAIGHFALLAPEMTPGKMRRGFNQIPFGTTGIPV